MEFLASSSYDLDLDPMTPWPHIRTWSVSPQDVPTDQKWTLCQGFRKLSPDRHIQTDRQSRTDRQTDRHCTTEVIHVINYNSTAVGLADFWFLSQHLKVINITFVTPWYIFEHQKSFFVDVSFAGLSYDREVRGNIVTSSDVRRWRAAIHCIGASIC